MRPKNMEMGSAGRARLTMPRIRLVRHRPWGGEHGKVWAPLLSADAHNEDGHKAAGYDDPVPITIVGCTPHQDAVEDEVPQP